MTIFKINDGVSVVCQYSKTRNGFKHTAALMVDGSEREQVKMCYLNRTWEAYEYQSVLQELLEKTKSQLSPDEVAQFETMITNGEKQTNSELHTVGMVARMGELFCTGDQKATNDWKARMLKAGLGNKGLSMPDNWDALDESEKQRRLDGAITQITKSS